jgi:hypothetical protein
MRLPETLIATPVPAKTFKNCLLVIGIVLSPLSQLSLIKVKCHPIPNISCFLNGQGSPPFSPDLDSLGGFQIDQPQRGAWVAKQRSKQGRRL